MYAGAMSEGSSAVSAPISSLGAVFQTVVVTAFADGRPDLDESGVVAELVALDPRFASLPDAFELAVQVRVLVDLHGLEEALEKITASITDAEHRKLSFRLCTRAMVADGKTDGDEALVLGSLQELFGLSHEEVVATLDEERKRRATP